MSRAPGQDAKDKGNAAFKTGDFATAIGHYTAAVLADGSNPTYPLNRAAAYLKLGKNEDAERDCTTTLKLDAKNVKAWFRRGQARAGMGRIAAALDDFRETLKLDPSNDASKQEIAKLEELKKKAASASKPRTPIEIPVPPLGGSTAASSSVKRRRVPIKIVDNASPSSVASSSKTTITSNSRASAAVSNADLLTPVSSRPLTSSTVNPPTPEQTSTPPPPPPPPKPATFKDLKQARDAARPSIASPGPSSRPGGGIFRSNGQHTLFNTQAPPQAQTAAPKPPSNPGAASASSTAAAPMTLFSFTRTWATLSSFDDRWSFLTANIPPQSLPALFQTSLEAHILASILQTFLHVLQEQQNPASRFVIKAYLLNLAKVPRFTTVVLFMSKQERKLVDEVWALVGPKATNGAGEDAEGGARKAWGVS